MTTAIAAWWLKPGRLYDIEGFEITGDTPDYSLAGIENGGDDKLTDSSITSDSYLERAINTATNGETSTVSLINSDWMMKKKPPHHQPDLAGFDHRHAEVRRL